MSETNSAPVVADEPVNLPSPVSTNATAEWETNEPQEKEKPGKKSVGDKMSSVRDSLRKADAKLKARPGEARTAKDGDHSTKGAVRRAMDKVGALPTVEDLNKPETRKDREALKARHPGRKLADVLATGEKWDADFKRDPVGTRERLMQAYLQVSPQNFKDAAPMEKKPGVRGSLEQAFRDQGDLAELAPVMEKYGKNFPHILSQFAKFDQDLTNDPVGVSARLAANYGAPVTAQQQQQYNHQQRVQKFEQQRQTDMNAALGELIQRNTLAGFQDESLQEEVAAILMDPKFKRTKETFNDLKRAHAQAVAARENKTKAGNSAVQLARGSKSISGAPSTAQGGARHGKGNSIRASLNRASGR